MRHLFFVVFSIFSVLVCVPAVHAESIVQTKVKLALNWKPEPQFGGFYAAKVGEHFAKRGLDVEILPGGSGTPTVQMVAAGQVDFAIVSADEVVISRSNGSDVVALFAAYQTNPQGIMVHADRGFKSLADVFKNEGKLAIQKGLPYASFLLKKYGSPKVQIVPYLGGITDFLVDKKYSQQCFVTSEPLAAAKKGAKTQTFLVAEEGFNPYTTVLVTRDKFLADKNGATTAKLVVEAVRAGWRDYLDKPEATNKLMAGLNKSMDLATFVEGANAQKPLIETAETKKSGLGTMTEDRWRTITTQLSDLKVIKKSPPANQLFKNL